MSIASLFHLQLFKFIIEADIQEFINNKFSFCIQSSSFIRQRLFVFFIFFLESSKCVKKRHCCRPESPSRHNVWHSGVQINLTIKCPFTCTSQAGSISFHPKVWAPIPAASLRPAQIWGIQRGQCNNVRSARYVYIYFPASLQKFKRLQ